MIINDQSSCSPRIILSLVNVIPGRDVFGRVLSTGPQPVYLAGYCCSCKAVSVVLLWPS